MQTNATICCCSEMCSFSISFLQQTTKFLIKLLNRLRSVRRQTCVFACRLSVYSQNRRRKEKEPKFNGIYLIGDFRFSTKNIFKWIYTTTTSVVVPPLHSQPQQVDKRKIWKWNGEVLVCFLCEWMESRKNHQNYPFGGKWLFFYFNSCDRDSYAASFVNCIL